MSTVRTTGLFPEAVSQRPDAVMGSARPASCISSMVVAPSCSAVATLWMMTSRQRRNSSKPAAPTATTAIPPSAQLRLALDLGVAFDLSVSRKARRDMSVGPFVTYSDDLPEWIRPDEIIPYYTINVNCLWPMKKTDLEGSLSGNYRILRH